MRIPSKPSHICLLLIAILAIAIATPALAASHKKLDKPPLGEHWFGIYLNNDRVGFYRQVITDTSEGYRMECGGSVHIKVMGIEREATTHEVYLVTKNLALRSFDVEQNIKGTLSRLSGRVADSTLRIKNENNGKITNSQIKIKGEVFPGPALNLYPLMRDGGAAKSYTLQHFSPEEIKVKEITITVLGEVTTPDGQPAFKLRNNLYPFVTNDIWIDSQGNTSLESVRDGLVTTKAEQSHQLAAFVGTSAINRKDLIYDFSMVRAVPPVRNQSRLTGLALEISGWNEALPLMQSGGQSMEKAADGLVLVKTGTALPSPPAPTIPVSREEYLKPADKIESDAPQIIGKAGEIAAGKNSAGEIARAVTGWTADWLKDTVNDGGGAVDSLQSRYGNCQTHARLYTALARAAGIPTRFVSGLVSLEGKGFLYHSWAESYLEGNWVAVDPTYNQLPADPTHLKLFEGHTQEDMAPIIAIIGKISIRVLESHY